jgi:phage shock protein C
MIAKKSSERNLKKLYKDKSTGYISGVMSGFAQYFNIDVTIVRVAYIVISALLFKGLFGILLYIILALIMPEKSEVGYSDYKVK